MYVFKDKKVRNDVLRKGGNQMKIIVTPEEMRSNATSLRSEKANFEQCNQQHAHNRKQYERRIRR